MKTELHYQFLQTKIPTIRHKQHYEFHFEFRPWDGHQMVDTQFLLYILVKIRTKSYHETNINKFYPIGFTHM
jgi:hypothetical protein